ncbi:1-aminocyclopropane-1-carboxylate deaminase/D-cysteine desulfhydrase [Amphritea japonica]|uniref:1-aminocyclopropane-1-carboxylate deaminase n=1 Tax=Amphritea japonica ATCC BAA-1530 TaxID=1278309 RepID=A0A7R6PBN3_9GAMM|nr:pyridoxal-phosphate dependent enzyme [Amphritea japonica]BBB26528.1 1-aminocyclopropane-1-carboxylate deaminase [Amphritea japonica ATCC BAA-1530]
MNVNEFPFSSNPSVPVVTVELADFQAAGVRLDLLRLDRVHPMISGNKWFKLKYAFEAVLRSDCQRVLSFGGAWSNHIHALAFAGRERGVETIAVIRGDEPVKLSDTLQDAQRWGMSLEFVSRAQYRNKYDEVFLQSLRARYGEFHLLPEGGSGEWVVAGCREILSLCDIADYDLVCCACGTGGTLAGLIAGKPKGLAVLGVPVLKGGDFLYQDIRNILFRAGVDDPGGWELDLEGHEGGYAKITPALALSMRYFFEATGVELEPVYTGKAFLALQRKLSAGELAWGSRVLLIHTGGMQGLRGMQETLSKRLSQSRESS